MARVGGPISAISLFGRNFSVPGDVDSNRKLGGSENEVQMNGDQTGRLIKTIMAWSLDGLTVSVDDDNDDQEYIQNIADGNAFGAITIEYASGSIYQGDGQVNGEVSFSSQNSTCTMALTGTGKLTKQ